MITLGGRACVEVKKIEDEINNYLDGYSIRILYGDKIYVKKKVSLPKKHAVKIKVVSVYFDGDKKQYFVKRFLIEQIGNKTSFISEHENSQLEIVSTDWLPQIELSFSKIKGKEKDNEIYFIYIKTT